MCAAGRPILGARDSGVPELLEFIHISHPPRPGNWESKTSVVAPFLQETFAAAEVSDFIGLLLQLNAINGDRLLSRDPLRLYKKFK